MPHAAIRLITENCTSCMICARECPTWCIAIESHTEPEPGSPPGPRQRTRAVLDAFRIDWTLCMFCGICVEECPFDALEWAADPPPAERRPEALSHGIGRLDVHGSRPW